MIDICEDLAPPTPFEDGILFAAGAACAVGLIGVLNNTWKEMFRRNEGCKGMER